MNHFVLRRLTVDGVTRVSVEGKSYVNFTNGSAGGKRRSSVPGKGDTSVREIIDTEVGDTTVGEILANIIGRRRKRITEGRVGRSFRKDIAKVGRARMSRVVIKVTGLARPKVAHVKDDRSNWIKVVFVRNKDVNETAHLEIKEIRSSRLQKRKSGSVKKAWVAVKMKTRVVAKKTKTTVKKAFATARKSMPGAKKAVGKKSLNRRRLTNSSMPD